MTALATDRLVRWLGLVAGLALAAVLVAGWRVPAGGGTLGAEATFVAAPPGELTAEPAGLPARARAAPGRRRRDGTLRVRNISPRRQRVRVRMAPSNRDLDRALYVELTSSGGRRLAAGPLGRLRRPSARALSIAPGKPRGDRRPDAHPRRGEATTRAGSPTSRRNSCDPGGPSDEVARLARAWGAVAGWRLGAGIALALVVPLAFGGRPYTVLSGSMEPAISTGRRGGGQPHRPARRPPRRRRHVPRPGRLGQAHHPPRPLGARHGPQGPVRDEGGRQQRYGALAGGRLGADQPGALPHAGRRAAGAVRPDAGPALCC